MFPAPEVLDEQAWPLCVVLCEECGLAQLADNAPLDLMYGDDYGYRSGLNQTMVSHLERIVRYMETKLSLKPGDNVLDIGSNDGTLLSRYRSLGLRRIGIDPTISKFGHYYPNDITKIPVFLTDRRTRI